MNLLGNLTMSNTERKPRKTNYQTFYKEAIEKKQGYVTKDGSWAAVPSDGRSLLSFTMVSGYILLETLTLLSHTY